jgi:cytochrome P450
MSEIAAIEPQLPEFFHPDILEDPAEWYGRAHAATPILRTEDGTHLVLSHALVSEAADRPEDFSSSFGALMSGQRQQDEEIRAISAQGWPVVDTMLTADDPVHARFRRLVNVAFASPRVNALESEIREIAASLLDAIAPNVPTDFMTAFAVPLPVTLIAEQIGLDRTAAPLVKRWSDASTTRHSGLISRERELECAHEMLAFQQFLKQKIDERRVSEDTRDLLGAVVNARVEGDRPLEDAEIMSVFQQLMVAGNETTTSTLAGGLLLLSRNPDQLAKVRANPALIRPMIEEMLRLLSPGCGGSPPVTRPWVASQSRPGSASCCASPPPIATRRFSPIPTFSTSNAATPTGISLSVAGFISASEICWRGRNYRWRLKKY